MRYYLALLITLIIPSLQGCFPVIAVGAGAGILMAEDRRTSGTIVEDKGIEIKASNRIESQLKENARVDVTSYNRNVLLTGQAATEETKQEAEAITRSVPNVHNVINEIAVGNPNTFSNRSNDAYLTSKVKARFVDGNKFQVNHIKVTTESGVVYLLGLVKHQEANDATEIARSTSGVQKVVRIFEYLD